MPKYAKSPHRNWSFLLRFNSDVADLQHSRPITQLLQKIYATRYCFQLEFIAAIHDHCWHGHFTIPWLFSKQYIEREFNTFFKDNLLCNITPLSHNKDSDSTFNEIEPKGVASRDKWVYGISRDMVKCTPDVVYPEEEYLDSDSELTMVDDPSPPQSPISQTLPSSPSSTSSELITLEGTNTMPLCSSASPEYTVEDVMPPSPLPSPPTSVVDQTLRMPSPLPFDPTAPLLSHRPTNTNGVPNKDGNVYNDATEQWVYVQARYRLDAPELEGDNHTINTILQVYAMEPTATTIHVAVDIPLAIINYIIGYIYSMIPIRTLIIPTFLHTANEIVALVGNWMTRGTKHLILAKCDSPAREALLLDALNSLQQGFIFSRDGVVIIEQPVIIMLTTSQTLSVENTSFTII
jgi:hypothetical protein